MKSKNIHSELRKNWRLNWLSNIYEFANPEFQRKLWVEASYNDMLSSFTECMCRYFDDSNLSDGYQYVVRENLMSKKEVNAVINFHILADQYDSKDRTDAEILLDTNWAKVTREAKVTWNRLKEILTDIDEIAYMKELEEKYGLIK